jgi:hypothetical protein
MTALSSSSSNSSSSHPLLSWNLVLFLGADLDLGRDMLDPCPGLDRGVDQDGETELEIPGIVQELEVISELELLSWLGGSFLLMALFSSHVGSVFSSPSLVSSRPSSSFFSLRGRAPVTNYSALAPLRFESSHDCFGSIVEELRSRGILDGCFRHTKVFDSPEKEHQLMGFRDCLVILVIVQVVLVCDVDRERFHDLDREFSGSLGSVEMQ